MSSEVPRNCLLPSWVSGENLCPALFLGISGGLACQKVDAVYSKFASNSQFFSQNHIQYHFRKVSKAWKLYYILAPSFIEEIALRGFFRDHQIEKNLKNKEEESFLDISKRISINSGIFTLAHISFKNSFKTNLRIIFPIYTAGWIFNLVMEPLNNIAAPLTAHCYANYLAFKNLKKI